ncbi:MAG: SCO family protein [Flavobacteriales bacterium]|nr:SCO family protein [Flavobacteriales bacterium]
MQKQLFLVASALLLTLIACHNNPEPLAYLKYYNADGVELSRKAPSFSFIDQEGKVITNQEVEGKTLLVDFFFTSCPTICPVMTTNMQKIQNQFASNDNLILMSHTVDPKRDTPEVLKQYAVERNIDLNTWHFLTGAKDSLYRVAYQYLCSAMEDSLAEGGFLHTEYFVLVDKNGYLRSRRDENGNVIGVYDGTDDTHIANLIEDMELLLGGSDQWDE